MDRSDAGKQQSRIVYPRPRRRRPNGVALSASVLIVATLVLVALLLADVIHAYPSGW